LTDCYRILGVERQASAAEIRGAYLTRMKAMHPDALRDGSAADGRAGEISSAYWQLRDPQRRAEHDRLLDEQLPPRRAQVRQGTDRSRRSPGARKRSAARPQPSAAEGGDRRPRRSRRLQPLRTAAGVAACLMAGAAFVVAYSYLDSQSGAQARTAPVVDARNPAQTAPRRALDPALASAAARSFKDIVRRSGLEGAHHYARQCLLELTAHPTLSLLDYCVAFDDEAADWENARQEENGRRYFADGQRHGRYESAVRGMKRGRVRAAMSSDIDYFATDR
jgi:curved DNA-binding protein CbpA